MRHDPIIRVGARYKVDFSSMTFGVPRKPSRDGTTRNGAFKLSLVRTARVFVLHLHSYCCHKQLLASTINRSHRGSTWDGMGGATTLHRGCSTEEGISGAKVPSSKTHEGTHYNMEHRHQHHHLKKNEQTAVATSFCHQCG